MEPEKAPGERRNLTPGSWAPPARPRVAPGPRLFETHERDVPCREELGTEAERKRPAVVDFAEAGLRNEKNRLGRLDLQPGPLRLEPFGQEAGIRFLRDFPGRTRLRQKPSDSKPYPLSVMTLPVFPGSPLGP
jgi:hypothetical protein